MIKFFKIAIVVILILANAAAVTVAIISPKEYKGYSITAGGKPLIGEKLDFTIPDDPEALKLFAYELYALANENFKKLENAAYAVNSVTTTMGIPVVGYRHFVKNKDALLYLEYSFVLNPIQAAILGFAGKDGTMFAERCYTDNTMDYMYAEKTIEPTHTVEESGVTYNAQWENLFYAKQKEKPIYHADQEKDFEYTDQIIKPETIKNAVVTYNAEEGYYRIELDLDVDNPLTTSKTLPNLRASSEAPDAHYTSMHETIEIWDNGYYKYFLSEDNWTGKRGFISLVSNIRFETDFLYDEDSLSFSNYQYADDLIAILKTGKMRSI